MSTSTVSKIKNICVFCGSSAGKDSIYEDVAEKLGITLAKRKIHLVYGGGEVGLMGKVAKAAHAGGSEVLGIIPITLANLTGPTIGEEMQVDNMYERITQMIEHSDAFIALPGGFGTLEEIFHTVCWAQLNIHNKPIGLLNVNNYYDKLLSFLDDVVEQGFISLASRRMLVSATSEGELIDLLQGFSHEPDPFLSQLNWPTSKSKKRKFM
ncbi:cytokinin riboside 5'-monophosphate phosphoribohydrolase LOG3-like [Primulina eburnea]|uniref:cytokinin riboside 5'-monophosphate phosphoribohydrolase LOG3-like n=1 Tax=Primulina eburnea TaxID=1245227 RepID=UPI003C6C2C99